MTNDRFLEWVLFAPTTSAETLQQWLLRAMQSNDNEAEIQRLDIEFVEGGQYSAILCYDESLEQDDADIAEAMAEWVDDAIHVVALHRPSEQYLIYQHGGVVEEILIGEPAAYVLSEKLGCPLSIWLPQNRREFFQVLLIEGLGLAEYEEKVGDTYQKLLTPVKCHQVSGGVVIRPIYTQDSEGNEMNISGESVPSVFSATQLFPNHVVSLITAKTDWSVFSYYADKGQQEVGAFSINNDYEEEDDEDDNDEYPVLKEVNAETDPKKICASFGISESLLFGKKETSN